MRDHESRRENAWFRLLFLWLVEKDRSRTVVFRPILDQYPTAAVLSGLHRTDGAQRGKKTSQESKIGRLKTQTWTSERQPQQEQDRSGTQPRVAAHSEDGTGISQSDPGHTPPDLPGASPALS